MVSCRFQAGDKLENRNLISQCKNINAFEMICYLFKKKKMYVVFREECVLTHRVLFIKIDRFVRSIEKKLIFLTENRIKYECCFIGNNNNSTLLRL